MIKLSRQLVRDQSGATVVEFGLLLPVILTGFLGVLQVGLQTFYYNTLRNVTSEASRTALAEYQGTNAIPEEDIEDLVIELAPQSGLNVDDITVTVEEAAVQRVDGAIEMTFTTTYEVPSLLPFLGINSFTATYSRPLFLIDDGLAGVP